MANLIDYLKWRGDVSFDNSPVNEIDALVFSELSYVHFDDLVPASILAKGIPLSILAEKYFFLHNETNKLGAILPTECIFQLFKLAADSERFKNVTVKGFINEVDIKIEKQFCAMCFDIGTDITVIVFRGTDDTIIGWKEDFNMAFFTPIPAQRQGAEYLTSVIERTGKKEYYVCGHSKGGNLATFASLTCEEKIKRKIKAVYNFDGPGFKKTFIEEHKDNSIIPRLKKVCPDGAIIGAIFNSIEDCKFAKSNAKGLYQHDAFSWEILGKEFVLAKHQRKQSKDFHQTLDGWVENLSEKERVEFVEALYKFFSVNETTTLTDIASDKVGFLIGVLKTDDKTKKTFFSLMNKLVKEKYFKKSSDNKVKKKKK